MQIHSDSKQAPKISDVSSTLRPVHISSAAAASSLSKNTISLLIINHGNDIVHSDSFTHKRYSMNAEKVKMLSFGGIIGVLKWNGRLKKILPEIPQNMNNTEQNEFLKESNPRLIKPFQ
jgi:hypothetical protein